LTVVDQVRQQGQPCGKDDFFGPVRCLAGLNARHRGVFRHDLFGLFIEVYFAVYGNVPCELREDLGGTAPGFADADPGPEDPLQEFNDLACTDLIGRRAHDGHAEEGQEGLRFGMPKGGCPVKIMEGSIIPWAGIGLFNPDQEGKQHQPCTE